MKISAILPWFGGKRTLAPRIVEQLGPHRSYWEPFCGSMAVLLAKSECSQETVNDLHGDLINLALVIQHDTWGPWLYRKLRRTLVHECIQEGAKEYCGQELWTSTKIEERDAHRAYWYFVASWLGRNGVIGTKSSNNIFSVRYTANGGIQGTRFASAVDSIPDWRKRMREVTILNRDGFELLERIEDAPGTAIYCDPPYLAKGAEYIHDFANEDHARLALLLTKFSRARVVVGYYAHEHLTSLYPGWNLIDCSMAKALTQAGARGSKKVTAPEVLLVNGPVYGDEGELW